MSESTPWVIAGLAAAAYYAYSQGWFTSAAASTTTTTAPPIPPTVNTQNILPANVMALSDQAAYQAWANQNGMTYAQIQAALAQVLANYQACAAPSAWNPAVVSATDLPTGCVAPPASQSGATFPFQGQYSNAVAYCQANPQANVTFTFTPPIPSTTQSCNALLNPPAEANALSGLRVGNVSRRHINAARYRI